MNSSISPMKHIFIFAVVLSLFSLTALAQITEATLKLSVVGAQSNALAGSSVEITNECERLYVVTYRLRRGI
jgi:hypothetical protein